jgi:hypothetical protein
MSCKKNVLEIKCLIIYFALFESGKPQWQSKLAFIMTEDFSFFQTVGIFANEVSNWLCLTTFFSIMLQCRFIGLDEMNDGFAVVPIILNIGVLLCCKYFKLFLKYIYLIFRCSTLE